MPIVAFHVADDLWPRERMREMAAALEEYPEWDGLMGLLEHFFSPEFSADEAARFEVPDGPQVGAGLPSLVVRRAAFRRAGDFLDGLSAGEYLEWSDRAVRADLRIEAVETLCLHRRVHLANFIRRPESNRDYLRAVMARRSGSAGEP